MGDASSSGPPTATPATSTAAASPSSFPPVPKQPAGPFSAACGAVLVDQPCVELHERRLQRAVDAVGEEARLLPRLHARVHGHVLRPDLAGALAYGRRTLGKIR